MNSGNITLAGDRRAFGRLQAIYGWRRYETERAHFGINNAFLRLIEGDRIGPYSYALRVRAQ